MKTVYVNHIETISSNVDYGLAVIDKTVKYDLSIIFEPHVLKIVLASAASNSKEGGINFFMRFCQYVVLVQLKVIPQFKGSLNFIDCHNNLDAALDQYLSYTENKWLPEQKNQFMQYFEEVRNDYSKEKAEMIIKDPLRDIQSYL